jgi:hypothetical protein
MNYNEMINLTDKRKPSYQLMIEHLKTFANPIIVETGCAREENNFEGDGMSTLIFDDYVTTHGGTFYSVDNNTESVQFSKNNTKSAKVICSDSIKYLYQLNKELREKNQYIDLLYLDSYDFDRDNPHPSSFHHLKEITAIIPSLRNGSMIVVDDNIAVEMQMDDGRLERAIIGKGIYTYHFFKDVGIEPVYMDYQFVWKL